MICESCVRNCWRDNAVLVRLLGVCPILALTTTPVKGAVAALILSAPLVGVSLVSSLGRSWVIAPLRPLVNALAGSLIVSFVWFYLHGWRPALVAGFDIYLPLMALNCLVLNQAEQVGARSRASVALLDAVTCALGVLGAVLVLGAVRELGATGRVLTDLHLLSGEPAAAPAVTSHGLSILATPAGALLALGLLIALQRTLRREPVPPHPAPQRGP
jgi:electron transport complex protein RnfE